MLTGLLFHDGANVKSGHYTALVKAQDQKWWRCNDTQTWSLTYFPHEFLTESDLEKVYVVVYEAEKVS